MLNFFSGKYEHQLDDKNRLRIPAKFKKGLTNEQGEVDYSFALGKNGCIYVFPNNVLEEIIEQLTQESLGEASVATMLFFSHIYAAEEDMQGRVVLPSTLKQLVGIKKDIVTVGYGRRLEIWSAEHYNEYVANANYDEEFKTLGI